MPKPEEHTIVKAVADKLAKDFWRRWEHIRVDVAYELDITVDEVDAARDAHSHHVINHVYNRLPRSVS